MQIFLNKNRRRHSIQLKIDDCIRQIAPRVGRKRSNEPRYFSVIEHHLEMLKSMMNEVDKERSCLQKIYNVSFIITIYLNKIQPKLYDRI